MRGSLESPLFCSDISYSGEITEKVRYELGVIFFEITFNAIALGYQGKSCKSASQMVC